MMLAVLPLHGASDSAENVALAGGLASTLAAKLGPLTRNHAFQLVPSVTLRGRGVETVAAAHLEFGCNRVLTVQFRREGERLRVNLGLVNAQSGEQITGAQVEGSAAAIFDFEAAVADRVLRMLQLELRPTDAFVLEAGTVSVGARELYLSGIGYQERAEDEEGVRLAVEQFRQALRTDPNFVKAHAALGVTYLAMYRVTRDESWLPLAKEECDGAVGLDALEAAGHACLGTYAGTIGEYQQAVDHHRTARSLEPTDDAVVTQLASVLRELSRPDEAEQTYLDAIALRPHYGANHDRLGTFYLLSGRVAEAIAAYEQAVQLAPDSYRNRSNLGNAYYFNDDLVAAERSYRVSISLNPEYAPPRSNLGTILFYGGEYRESATMFKLAVQIDPARVDYWGNLGDAHWFAGDEVDARVAFERALGGTEQTLAVNPNQAEVQAQAAYYLSMLGRTSSVVEHIEAALALEPEAPRVLRKIGQALQAQGNIDDALIYLQQAVDHGYSREEIRTDPLFRSLEHDERFVAIVGR